MNQKIILAYSGGLDTSFCVPYLKEKGYDVITLTVDTGGLNKDELEYIESHSKELGASKHYFVDAKDEVYEKIITNVIKANGLYQGVYPLMCSDRFLFGKYAKEIADKEGTNVIAHGCTGTGNDQFRIELPVLAMYPEIEIVAPVKELGSTRDYEIEYLEKKGFEVPKEVKKYTYNQNVFGVTISGSEIDENKEIPESAWVMSKVTKTEPEYVEIEFEKGVPVGLDGKNLPGIEILGKLNEVAGAHGYGQGYYIEDEILGIKGQQAFEAPGLMLIIEAHKTLEKLTLTKEQLSIKHGLEYTWAEYAYLGKLFDPMMKDVQAFFDSTQESVNGKVKMKLEHKSAFLCEVHSPNSLIDEDVALYAQKATWTGGDVNAFMKFYGMQSTTFNKKNEKTNLEN
ncbi:MAG: argininosuccinate synthase [archaeon]